MSEDSRTDIAKRTIVLEIPGMDAVRVQKDVVYTPADAGASTLDVYAPPGAKEGERRPAVVFVFGYPEPRISPMLGCRLKEMGAYTSWGRLVAASGMVAVTSTCREPVADFQALLRYLRANAASLGIDEERIAVWSCSGNVPAALSVLMLAPKAFQCAVLCYGYMLDLGGSTSVAQAAAHIKFANPCAGKSVDDLPKDLPLFLVRAGQDQTPGLNGTIDAFVTEALARNMPLTVANHATGPHAFDMFDDSEISREMIRRIVSFLQFHLRA